MASEGHARSGRTKPSTFVLGALTLAAFVAVIAAFVFTTWSERLAGERPCAELPDRHEAEEIMRKHPSLKFHIERVNAGPDDVVLSSARCRGKAELVITHASRSDRDEIEDLLEQGSGAEEKEGKNDDDDETYYGIPVTFSKR
ncbi:MAG TPA: hypothetical protein VND22_06345 [Actinomycetota bacterium]|nr:hypothetical protein [Actinomycetota bacterium]